MVAGPCARAMRVRATRMLTRCPAWAVLADRGACAAGTECAGFAALAASGEVRDEGGQPGIAGSVEPELRTPGGGDDRRRQAAVRTQDDVTLIVDVVRLDESPELPDISCREV